MYNPTTRRAKRFRQLSTGRSFTESTYLDVPREDGAPTSSLYAPRQAVQPDVLRGAMLVALIVVTIVLYILLWELERSSFVSVPNPKPPSSSSSDLASTWHPHPTLQAYFSGGKFDLVDDQKVPRPPSSKPDRLIPKWPPPITRVPEKLGTYDLAKEAADRTHKYENTNSSSFDSAYCNGTCRFLLPVRIGEQESKARIHFMQLLILARRLDRTIVLPNVGKGRMSACSKWHFGAYYDTNGLVRRSGSLESQPAVDLEEFAKWVDGRPVSPTSFAVSVESIPQGHHNPDMPGSQAELEVAPFVVDKTEADSKILSCLDYMLARLRVSLPNTTLSISFNSRSRKTDSDASTCIVDLLSSNLNMDTDNTDADFDLMMGLGYDYTPHPVNASYPSLADVDVLILDYDLRHPLFTASARPNFNLHYAPVLYDLADRLSDHLGPFLGIQWRMETVPAQNLAWCAVSLVSALHGLLQDDITGKHIRHVWLATDHPGPLIAFMDGMQSSSGASRVSNSEDGSTMHNYGASGRSSTFRALSSEHDDAIRTLVEAFQPEGELDAWKLTDLTEQLRRYPYVEGQFNVDEALLNDPGVFGILDKLVIVQAKVFVSGSADCSKTSSFSKQVIEARRDLFGARGKSTIRNVVEYFGKW